MKEENMHAPSSTTEKTGTIIRSMDITASCRRGIRGPVTLHVIKDDEGPFVRLECDEQITRRNCRPGSSRPESMATDTDFRQWGTALGKDPLGLAILVRELIK
jgi:hypothetical protein